MTKLNYSRLLHNIWVDLRDIPSTLIVQHSRALDMIILLVGFAIGFYAVITLLFLQPTIATTTITNTTPTLDSDALDQLELWMEERQTATENPLRFNNPGVFDPIPSTDVH